VLIDCGGDDETVISLLLIVLLLLGPLAFLLGVDSRVDEVERRRRLGQ
jgi:hypothetical protein